MDLAQLKIFTTVVEAGGVTHAAKVLNRVQSNVTTRVRQLEDELETALFLRQGKKLLLTPQGQTLLEYAKRILQLAEEAREAMHDHTPRGNLRLGASESAAMIRLPAILNAYNREYPDVSIRLRTGTTEGLLELLQDDQLDAALTNEPDSDFDLEKTFVYEDTLVVVDRVDNPILEAGDETISGTILAFEKGCMARKRLEDWFMDRNVTPHKFIELNSYSTIFSCVTAGMGITVAPSLVVEAYSNRDQLRIHVLPDHIKKNKYSLYWRKGMKSPKIEALNEVLKSL